MPACIGCYGDDPFPADSRISLEHRRGYCQGPSVIQGCYAAIKGRELSTLTNVSKLKNRSVTYCSDKKCLVEEKMSLNVSRLAANPACVAGVRT